MLNPNINSVKFSKEEYIQYTKHLILKQVGKEGQKRLKKAKILIIGAGGLGCPAMLYLIASGVGYLGIIDKDTVNFSNLNRQILYSQNKINQKKTSSAKEQLKAINKYCKIITHSYYFNKKNGAAIVQYYDIVVDTTDNFKTRYIIDKICHKLNKIHIYGAVQEFEGQIGVLNYKNGIKYTDLYSPLLNIENFSCHDNGILGVMTAHIGILQATQAIKIILGIEDKIDNSILTSNLLNMNVAKRKIYINKKNKKATQNNINHYSTPPQIISTTILKNIQLKTKSTVIILDIRQNYEFYTKHIKNSINIPLINFKIKKTLQFIKQHNDKNILIVSCNKLNRSIIASNILHHYKIKHYILSNKQLK